MNDAMRITELESERCRALTSVDAAALSLLLADDYVHVHGNGHVDDKSGFIRGMRERPRTAERGELTIRVYGDAAVITGIQSNKFRQAGSRVTSNFVTQVARRSSAGNWQFVSFQITPIVTPPDR